MSELEPTTSEKLVQAASLSGASAVSMSAAFHRARTLDSIRIIQDFLNRIAMLFLTLPFFLSGHVSYQGRIAACFIVFLFCVMWQVSKSRLYDTVSQIEGNYITGAQDAFKDAQETKWEQLLIILGSRATSRRDIVAMERVLQLEPALWGALAILVISLGWS
jgi:hypothetical protein